MGGGVAVSVKGDWVVHKVLYTCSIAFHSSGTTAPYYCCSIKQDVVGVGYKCTMQLRWQCAAFEVTSLRLETCTKCTGQPGSIPTMHSAFHANQTANFMITGRIVHLMEFWLIFYRWFVCTNRFIKSVFNVPKTCCCWWLCLPRSKKTTENRTHPWVCTVY